MNGVTNYSLIFGAISLNAFLYTFFACFQSEESPSLEISHSGK